MLGILAINVTGFWGPPIASETPLLPAPESGGALWFSVAQVLFEGKMRALFTLLFGASLELFARAAERRGVDPTWPQLRRLGWLALFGYLHYALLWWGDILFAYALCGVVAIALRGVPVRLQVFGALAVFAGFSLMDSAATLQSLAAEARVAAGSGSADDAAFVARAAARIAREMAQDTAAIHLSWPGGVGARLADGLLPLRSVASGWSETLPLMLLGMALLRGGVITGWSRRRLATVGALLLVVGSSATLALALWAAGAGYPPRLTAATLAPFGDLPALAMALGYGALFFAAWPWLATRAAGRTLAAAGRCAFTNYLGTSLVMTMLFCGWGLDLGAGGSHPLPRGLLPLVMLGGWALMLAWPRWWLARFGQGPLEALWRRLTWGRGRQAASGA